MNTPTEEERRCANEGCERTAEPDSLLCPECNLEWSLFHRELRVDDVAHARLPVPASGIPVLFP